MIKSWLVLILFLLCGIPSFSFAKTKNASPPSQEQALSLYKEHQVDQALRMLSKLVEDQPNNDDLRYYLSLCYAQIGDALKSAETFKPLLDKDPSFYLYKIHFDADLAPVRGSPAFFDLISSHPATYLAEAPDSQDSISQSPIGLYLYRNGIKILLKEGDALHYWGGFLDRDLLYYAWTNSDPKAINGGISLYSRQSRQSISVDSSSKEEILNVRTATLNQIPFIVCEVKNHFYIYALINGLPKQISFYDGQISEFNQKEGSITYLPVVKKKRKQSVPITLQLTSFLPQNELK